jgi:hypothetical protein
MPVLIIYAKSKRKNMDIHFRFFLKQAFINNILLLIFSFAIYNSISNKIYYFMIIGLIIFSIILSFAIMYTKNQRLNKKTKKLAKNKLNINPKIKSILHDYLSSDFLTMVILCYALFIILIIEITKNINNLQEMESQTIFYTLLTIAFSIGFMGIFDSIPKINWKFQAILSSNDYKYHYNRTMLILLGVFGWLIIPFVVMGFLINPLLLIKYLYCIFVLLLITINISFFICHILVKGIILTLFIGLTMWISTLSAWFLPILALPVILTFVKAKNEYKEWFLS